MDSPVTTPSAEAPPAGTLRVSEGVHEPLIELRGIRRTFTQGERTLEVLRGVSFGVRAGEMLALVGPSGSGKSTLLHIAGLLERPDAGEVVILGQRCESLPDHERTLMRRDVTGFVYQFHHLLAEFSATENIMLPQMVAGRSRRQAARRAEDLLALVGLSERASHRPAQLSGGEQQRVALARALANEPVVLLADEPTGNLDPATAFSVFAVLETLVARTGIGAVVATHNRDLAHRMSRMLELRNGTAMETA